MPSNTVGNFSKCLYAMRILFLSTTILHANQTYLSLCGTSYPMVASCTHQCLSHRCVERQLKQSSKYQSIERKATRKYCPAQLKVKQKGTHSKMSKTWIMYQHEFHFRCKIQCTKTDFWDPKLFINTASSISCCCSWPEWI